jgi:hypothetical protein
MAATTDGTAPTTLAIQGLESAINHGGMGHAEIATTAAQEALNPLHV